MKQLDENDPVLIKALEDIVQTSISEALPQKPVYTLREILPHKTAVDLKGLAKASQVTGYSKMKKAELVRALCDSLPNPDNIEIALNCLERQEWEFFKKAAKHKQLTDNLAFVDSFATTQSFGFLQAFFNDGNMIFVVPEEIRTAFSDMVRNGTADRIERSVLLDCYAQAAVNLYGIIPIDELTELFNGQNERKTTEDELFSTLLRHIHKESVYCFWEEYLVHMDFEEDDFNGVAALEDAIRGKKRYIPPKEEFLQYADYDYYEQTPQVEKLEGFILEHLTQDRMEAMEIADEIVLTCMAEARMKDVMGVFEEHGIVFQGKEQVERLMPILTDVWNNVRIWSNKGHTPNEMTDNFGRPVLRVLPGAGKKPGRNDPCPCGSGKKYKKCCGRND